MAWYTGNISAAASQLLGVWDACLPLNPYWTIDDSPALGLAANTRVYRNACPAKNSYFCVQIQDTGSHNNDSIYIWEDWDNVTHSGIGQVLSWGSYGFRIWRENSTASRYDYGLSVRDTNFVWVHLTKSFATYIGNPKRYNENQQSPLFIGRAYNTISTPARNPLGQRNYETANEHSVAWFALMDGDGAPRCAVIPFGDPTPTTRNTSTNVTGIRNLDSAGKGRIEETELISISSQKIFGRLDGAMFIGNASAGVTTNGQTILDDNGDEWLHVANSTLYNSLVRK
jgi:hypothetical protein